ncbi:hypothetical protein [Geodermatophilus sp. CPCC 206100]|uniref:hypothetical protein n=1 Tax=Geodermatophilus sp. CPCC 206100 TaxID=3020054 RepID=UPI003B00B300
MPDQVDAALAAQRGLWAWGEADDIVPWSGPDGRDVVPLWTSADDAAAGSAEGADPGEGPVFLDLDALLDAIPQWMAAGVPDARLHPGDGAPLTVPLPELTERVLRRQVG